MVLPFMQFNFYRLKVQNAEQCNATEVDGAGQFAEGNLCHPDTIAHVIRYQHAQHYIERLAPGSQILDLGCGELQLLRFLQMNRCRWPAKTWYWGYDVRAKQAWHKHLRNGPDAVNLVRQSALARWPDDFPRQYELIICYELFEHVPIKEQPELLRRIYQLCRPGGIVLFSSPNGGRRRHPVANHIGADGDRERAYYEKRFLTEQAGFVLIDEFGTGCRVDNLREEYKVGIFGRARNYLPLSLFLGTVSLDHSKESNGSTFTLLKPACGKFLEHHLMEQGGGFDKKFPVTLKLNKRNIFTMLCSNVMFVDLDGEHDLEELNRLCVRLKWHCRAYRTAAGWRLIEIGRLQEVDDRILKTLSANGVDARYIRICRGSKAWRARLRPKARRLGLNGDHWDRHEYNLMAFKFATCRYMGEVGRPVYTMSNTEREHVNKVVELHDGVSQAFSPLPLR